MKITINTDVLKKYNLSLGQFLVLLVSHFNLDCQKIHDELVSAGLAERDLFKGFPPVISDNTKNLIAKIIVESDDKITNCHIKDFNALAETLMQYYPEGNKPGTTYPWRGTINEISQKLKTLVAKYDFDFTPEEAQDAVMEYVNSFKDYKFMSLLRNFILTTKKDDEGRHELNSLFMTIIENNRESNENNN